MLILQDSDKDVVLSRACMGAQAAQNPIAQGSSDTPLLQSGLPGTSLCVNQKDRKKGEMESRDNQTTPGVAVLDRETKTSGLSVGREEGHDRPSDQEKTQPDLSGSRDNPGLPFHRPRPVPSSRVLPQAMNRASEQNIEQTSAAAGDVTGLK